MISLVYLFVNWHIHVKFLLRKDLWDRVVRSQSPPLATELCFNAESTCLYANHSDTDIVV